MALDLKGQIDPIIKEVEAKRQSLKSFFLGMVLGGVGAMVLGILLLFLYFMGSIGWTPIVYVSIALAAVGFILVMIAIVRSNNLSKYAVRSLRNAVEQACYTNIKKNPKGGFPLPELLYSGFFSAPDRYDGSNLTSGICQGIPFEHADFTFYRREVQSNGKTTTVTYVPYASGTFYRFDFGRQFPGEVRILEKGAFGLSIFGGPGKKQETEYIEFNKKFAIYSTDETLTFYLLTPQIQEKIMKLEQGLSGTFDMAFLKGNHLYCVLEEQSALKVSLFKEFDKEKVAEMLLPIAFPHVVVENLDLTDNKFKKNAGVNPVG